MRRCSRCSARRRRSMSWRTRGSARVPRTGRARTAGIDGHPRDPVGVRLDADPPDAHRAGSASAPRSAIRGDGRMGSTCCGAWRDAGRSSTTCLARSRWCARRRTSRSRGSTSRQLGGDVRLFERLKAEFDATVERHAADQRERCVDAGHAGDPVGDHAAQSVRGSVVTHPDFAAAETNGGRVGADAAAHSVDAVLSTTLSGIAQGLRNTG